MTTTVRVKANEYGMVVHEDGTVDLLVADSRKAIPGPLAALVGAFLLLRSDPEFVEECLSAFQTYHFPAANEVPA